MAPGQWLTVFLEESLLDLGSDFHEEAQLPLAPPFQFWGLILRNHKHESLRMDVRDRRLHRCHYRFK